MTEHHERHALPEPDCLACGRPWDDHERDEHALHYADQHDAPEPEPHDHPAWMIAHDFTSAADDPRHCGTCLEQLHADIRHRAAAARRELADRHTIPQLEPRDYTDPDYTTELDRRAWWATIAIEDYQTDCLAFRTRSTLREIRATYAIRD